MRVVVVGCDDSGNVDIDDLKAKAAFMRATHATYKLGIDFHDFGRIGERYVHPFGTFGEKVAGVPFHHYWLELAARGMAGPIGAYSLALAAATGDSVAPPAEDALLRTPIVQASHVAPPLFPPGPV